MVELLPSKQNVASSSLVSRSSIYVVVGSSKGRPFTKGSQQWFVQDSGQTSVDRPCGSVVEHSLGKGEVARSIRAMGTKGM